MTTESVKTETKEPEVTTVTNSLRPFDVNSLIKKEETCSNRNIPVINNNHANIEKPPCELNMQGHDVAGGPGLYPYLGLYSHLMSMPHHPGPPLLPGLNPLMQAQIALAAHAHQQSVLASAYANLHPSSMMERLKSQRFSPYQNHKSPNSSHISTSDSKSAFTSVTPGSMGQSSPTPGSPPPSPSSHTATTSLRIKTISPPILSPAHSQTSSSPGENPLSSSTPSSKDSSTSLTPDIRNIEAMVNGLNGGHDTKFGITHESHRTLTKSQ